jgi:hypothetical protein
MVYNFKWPIVIFFLFFASAAILAQDQPTNMRFSEPTTFLWLGNYGTFRLSDKFFWTGEFHYRRTQYNDVPFVGRMAQLYNRHGVMWVPTKRFSMTLGGVLRFDFTPEPGNADFEAFVLEPRIWHEYMFVMPFEKFMVYHRLRFEHRWSRRANIGDDYIFRNRYRYKFQMKIPINSDKLMPGTWYLSPDIEIIMQSGKSITSQPLEDLRLFPHVAYIANSRWTYSGGLMWTTGQEFFDSALYRNRWIARLNVYLSLDFRKFESKIPQIRIMD